MVGRWEDKGERGLALRWPVSRYLEGADFDTGLLATLTLL